MNEQRMSDIANGAALTWADWLTEHDVTTLDAVTEGAADAVGVWLDRNAEAVISAIAKVVAATQRTYDTGDPPKGAQR